MAPKKKKSAAEVPVSKSFVWASKEQMGSSRLWEGQENREVPIRCLHPQQEVEPITSHSIPSVRIQAHGYLQLPGWLWDEVLC